MQRATMVPKRANTMSHTIKKKPLTSNKMTKKTLNLTKKSITTTSTKPLQITSNHHKNKKKCFTHFQQRGNYVTSQEPTAMERLEGQKPVDLNFRKYASSSSPNPTLPPLVILHGLLGHANNWANIAGRADLRDNRDVYTLDLRNHGMSPHTNYTDYVAMANDVSQFIQKHCPAGLATVVGHSMGGKAVAALGLLHPHVVTGLVIVDILPIGYPEKSMEEIHSLLDTVAEVDFANNANRREVEQQLAKNIADGGIRQWLLTNITSVDQSKEEEAARAKEINQVVKWKPNVKGLRKNYANIRGFDLHQDYVLPFNGPTHLILGGRSSFGDRNSSLAFMHENNFPECTLSVIEDAGHWCHAEKPHDFAAQLLGFLQKHGL